MDIVERHEQGAAVEDVQRRLAQMGYLTEDAIDGSTKSAPLLR